MRSTKRRRLSARSATACSSSAMMAMATRLMETRAQAHSGASMSYLSANSAWRGSSRESVASMFRPPTRWSSATSTCSSSRTCWCGGFVRGSSSQRPRSRRPSPRRGWRLTSTPSGYSCAATGRARPTRSVGATPSVRGGISTGRSTRSGSSFLTTAGAGRSTRPARGMSQCASRSRVSTRRSSASGSSAGLRTRISG